jgi:organic hydroperoxide reductase OsmC/OhrA
MADALYTAQATVTGGRAEGHGATSDGQLDVQLRTPTERVDLGDVSIDSRVSLITTENRGFTIGVALDVTLPDVKDADTAAKVVAAAHQVCPYSNATRGNIEVALTANGQPVD